MRANPQPGEVRFIDFGYEAKPRYGLVLRDARRRRTHKNDGDFWTVKYWICDF